MRSQRQFVPSHCSEADTPHVVLFGAGSPIIVDVEETCSRWGWRIVAVVKNVPGDIHASGEARIVEATLETRLDHPVVVPLFSPANRRHAWHHAVSLGASTFPSLIDPTSILPRRIEIAEGVYINAGCTIGAAARIGRFAFVNRGANLGHHLDLGEFASIGPGVTIAGQVTVGADAMIGAGAVVLPGISIGRGAIVAAGAVVHRDVPDGVTVIGQPAA
jgi:sugar O-acyltransferase (sialic acid O-acetyltransferase NeuD family)